MFKTYGALLWWALATCMPAMAQEDSTRHKLLGEIVLSVNKWEQPLSEVPNRITRITKPGILLRNPQTSADLLAQSGTVFIQKSQLGGGSPMIRGFATNRVLLVVDGVRMNNAIYRSGNLQNVISIDPLAIESAEVIFGPGSLLYGSDAIGGVMDFHTLEARLSPDSKRLVKGAVQVRYATANKEKTAHFDLNIGGKKWSFLSSLSHSDFDDLRMGKSGGQDNYLRTQYVIRQNNSDVVINNPDPRLQRFSGYQQFNFLQKLRYRPSDKLDLVYGFTYAGTGYAPRYDRLIQYRNGAPRFAEWNYGPMLWRMHQLQALLSGKTTVYDQARVTVSYQNYEESRIDRTRNSSFRNRQEEDVDAIGINADAHKQVGRSRLYYGLEYVHNSVGSMGETTNVTNGQTSSIVSRYPDGSTWRTAGVYGSFKTEPGPRFTLTTGLRYSHNRLHAPFDTSFIKFPYREATLQEGGLTGNAALVFRPSPGWKLNFGISTGYRMPNVDDIGKLFESAPGHVTVPNPALASEYAWNFEVGFSFRKPSSFQVETHLFYTLLDNAIVRRPFSFNGNDSIEFDGVMSRVEALQNVSTARVYGLQVSAEYFFSQRISFETHANWIRGEETDDEKNEQVPLRHAAPFYGSSFLRYRYGRVQLEASAAYNAAIRNEELAPSEQVKTEIYARDAWGRPYSPGWCTFNLKTMYRLSENLTLTAGWENISNRRYRPYSSGIVAPGSNLILALRATL